MESGYDVIVVGGGPAGLTAAIYARRAGKSVLVLERATFGGQIATSPRVDNFPGMAGISGAELSDKLCAQAEALGAELRLEEVLEIQNGDLKCVMTDYGVYTAKAVILATGMRHRTLGLEEEDTLAGVSFCAVCDGAFYEGRDVAVCGGGSTALQEALFLADLCRHVTLIHRREEFRGDAILVEALRKRNNVTLALDTVVEGLESRDGALTGLRLRNIKTERKSNLAVEALFEAVGFEPETGMIKPLGISGGDGFLEAGEDCRTAATGIFAAGDCREKPVRQLTTACADGTVAALAACRYCG